MKLPPLSVSNVLTALGLAGSVLAFATGYGKVLAQQELMMKEVERQGRLVDAIYQNAAFAQTGAAGPARPLPSR